MAISNAIVLELLYQALKVEIGLGVKVTDRTKFRSQIYTVRNEAGDPELDKLIMFEPNGDEVWICLKTVEL